MCLTTKAEISRWTKFFEKRVEETLKEKILLASSLSKINDGTSFKDSTSATATISYTRKKKIECWGMHLEIIKSK